MIKFLKTDADAEKSLIAKWGGYNSFPDGWRETEKKEDIDMIENRLSQALWIAQESRQMYPPGPPYIQMVSATLYFTEAQNGFAVSRIWTLEQGWIKKYYLFGCQHSKSVSKKLGNCWYQYTCQDCGYQYSVDSSG